METGPSKRNEIINTLNGKSEVKLKSFDHTLEIFQTLKNALHELSCEINEEVNNNRKIKVEYRDKGQFEAHFQFASDILIFNMHTNVFQFKLDDDILVDIIETLTLYAMNFDLLVPKFDTVKIVEVEQMNTKIENSKISTGKRLGYTYNTDDI